jgi:hypothetical protein
MGTYETREVRTKFWQEIRNKMDYYENLGVKWKKVLEWFKWVWTGFIWFGIGPSGGLLWTR